MSAETIEAIHKAIQDHIDDQQEDSHGKKQLVDFVVCTATLGEHGGWNYNYVCSNLISPHGTGGLIDRAAAQLEEDLMCEVDVDPGDI